MADHVWFKCATSRGEDCDCDGNVCHGGLGICTVCHGAALVQLTTM